MNLLVILPILIPLAAGALSLLGRHSQRVQAALAVIGSVALVASAVALLLATWEHGHIVTELGRWPAPFGIVLVSDLLAAIMVLLSAVTGAATAF
ncbi:MAG: Na+/H+ antiporter subunit D, partial [Alcanivorax sp.]|nr:Na+/H+ antiporter subunit D [Alcanivorax sp.]